MIKLVEENKNAWMSQVHLDNTHIGKWNRGIISVTCMLHGDSKWKTAGKVRVYHERILS